MRCVKDKNVLGKRNYESRALQMRARERPDAIAEPPRVGQTKSFSSRRESPSFGG